MEIISKKYLGLGMVAINPDIFLTGFLGVIIDTDVWLELANERNTPWFSAFNRKRGDVCFKILGDVGFQPPDSNERTLSYFYRCPTASWVILCNNDFDSVSTLITELETKTYPKGNYASLDKVSNSDTALRDLRVLQRHFHPSEECGNENQSLLEVFQKGIPIYRRG